MATVTTPRATFDDLYKVEGKAELIGGRIVQYMATGHLPNRVAGNIYIEFRLFAKTRKQGQAYTDSMGFAVPELTSGRESFSPDVSYYEGPLPNNPMRFVEGPAKCAVEVRSENDYSPAAERAMAAKRDDYFEAGTLVVWDVDPIAQTVTVYRASASSKPEIFRKGDTVDAEPAMPGWRMKVDDIFAA